MLELILVAASSFLGGAIQATSGFGSAAVIMVFLPLVYGMRVAPALCGAISGLLAVSLAFHFRKYIKIKRLVVPIVSSLVASTSSILISSKLDLDLLSILFGVFLILLALYFFVLKAKLTFRDTLPCAMACGFGAGLTSGLFAVGGPLMAAYFLATTEKNEEYIGNMQGYFLVTCTINFCTRFAKGLYTTESVLPILIGTLGILIGKKLGLKLLAKMDALMLTRAVYSVIALSGVLTILNHL